jgi:hypothetical protein
VNNPRAPPPHPQSRHPYTLMVHATPLRIFLHQNVNGIECQGTIASSVTTKQSRNNTDVRRLVHMQTHSRHAYQPHAKYKWNQDNMGHFAVRSKSVQINPIGFCRCPRGQGWVFVFAYTHRFWICPNSEHGMGRSYAAKNCPNKNRTAVGY